MSHRIHGTGIFTYIWQIFMGSMLYHTWNNIWVWKIQPNWQSSRLVFDCHVVEGRVADIFFKKQTYLANG